MYNYYIINQRGTPVKITADEIMKEFCISKEDITEHLQAQLAYLRDGHKDHKIQPIMVGISESRFIDIVHHLGVTYSGFLESVYLAKGVIPIKMNMKGSELIRIVNEDRINIEE